MEIQRKFFPKVMSDNDEIYFAHLEGIICSVDEHSSMLVTKQKDCYQFRIAPSLPKYNDMLIEQLINFHNMFDIKLVFSKSIKASGTIVFKIEI